MATYQITDSFLSGGAGQNGLTVNAYAESRFSTPPAKNAAAPDGNAPDATATTDSTYGNDGSFRLTVPAAGDYWVSVAYSGTTYWKLYNVVPVGGAVSGLTRYGTGAPSSGVGNPGDFYVDEAAGTIYGPKLASAAQSPTFVGSAVGTGSVVIPAGVQVGDLLILSAVNGASISSTPAGWTSLATGYSGTSNNGARYNLSYRFAQAGDAGSTVVANNQTYQAAALVAYRGSGGNAPTLIGTVQQFGNGSALPTNGSGPVHSYDLMLGITLLAYSTVEATTGPSSLPAGAVARAVSNQQSSQTDIIEITAAGGTTVIGAPNDTVGPGFVQVNVPGSVPSNVWGVGVALPQPPATRYGTGLPTGGTGNVGDYYIDESTGNLYGPKASSTGAAIAYRSASSSTSSSLALPAGTAVGDYVVVVTMGTSQGGVPYLSDTNFATLGSGTVSGQAWTAYGRLITSGDIGQSVLVIPGTSGYTLAMAYAYQNVASATVGTAAGGNSGSSIPAITDTPAAPGQNDVVLHASIWTTGIQTSTQASLSPAGTARPGYANNQQVTGVATEYAGAVTATLPANYTGIEVLIPITLVSTIPPAWPFSRTLVASSGGIGTTKWTAVKTAAYTAVAGDAVPCDTTGGTFVVTLNSGLANGAAVRVKWKAGTAAPTVAAANGVTVDATWTGLGTVGDAVDFSFNSTTNVWEVV